MRLTAYYGGRVIMQLAADVQSNIDTEGRESIEDILNTIQARKRTIWGNQETLMHVIFFQKFAPVRSIYAVFFFF